jgi:glycosyltransferase involved in cell wall biosynthesis
VVKARGVGDPLALTAVSASEPTYAVGSAPPHPTVGSSPLDRPATLRRLEVPQLPSPPPEVTVVIAARDEAAAVGAVVRGVREILGPGASVLVVDDGSVDDTAAVAEEAGAQVIVSDRRGKGAAMRAGIAASAAPRLVFIDADGQHDPADIPALLARREALVLGSRLSTAAPRASIVGNRLLTAAFGLMYGRTVADSQTGFRVIDGELARGLSLARDGYEFEAEVLARVVAAGLEVGEVPVRWLARSNGRSRLRKVRDGLRILACMASVRLDGR